MAEWYTPETVVEVWPDADGIPEALLAAMLDIARGDVLAYAPASVEGSGEWVDGYYVAEAVPNRYVHAQLRQAQNIWRADSSVRSLLVRIAEAMKAPLASTHTTA